MFAPLFRHVHTSPRGAAVLAVVVALSAESGTAAAQNALETATLRLDWLASGYHAPFFLAYERGYYRDQGIDLKIFDGKGSTTTIQVVASGTDTFGAANMSSMALGVARGMPVVAIAGLIQKSPDAVISLTDAGIKEPKDIQGRRGGFVASGATDRLFPAFAKSAGVDLEKVVKRQIESNARYSVLLQGNADFVLGWSFTDAYKISKQKPIGPPILFSDYGVNILSVGIITARDTATKRGPLVRGFLTATMRGLADTISGPEKAVKAVVKHRPDADGDSLLAAARKLKDFVQTDNSKSSPLGWMSPKDWEQSRRILVEYLGMSDSIPADNLYTNSYLTAPGN